MADQGDLMNQASQIWTMLDDMAENNPAAYRKFIDKQMQEGKDLASIPKPHMSVSTIIKATKVPVYINFCSWVRIAKPKDDSSPIPVYGSKMIKPTTSTKDGEHVLFHVAFNPEVLEQFGLSCKCEAERDALIKLGMTYLEDQHKFKLSTKYTLLKETFKGELNSIREDFGLETSAKFQQDMAKLASGFGPVADIATKDPSLLDNFTEETIHSERSAENIRLPGTSNGVKPKGTLIEEVRTTPTYVLTTFDEDSGQCLIVAKIQLDSIGSVQQCELDVTESHIHLSAGEYLLDVDLQDKVTPELVKAKFSKSKHQLTVSLPLAKSTD